MRSKNDMPHKNSLGDRKSGSRQAKPILILISLIL